MTLKTHLKLGAVINYNKTTAAKGNFSLKRFTYKILWKLYKGEQIIK